MSEMLEETIWFYSKGDEVGTHQYVKVTGWDNKDTLRNARIIYDAMVASGIGCQDSMAPNKQMWVCCLLQKTILALE